MEWMIVNYTQMTEKNPRPNEINLYTLVEYLLYIKKWVENI